MKNTTHKLAATVAIGLLALLGTGAAQARDADVRWSVTIGSPAPAYRTTPVYTQPVYDYRTPRYDDRYHRDYRDHRDHRDDRRHADRRWDVDGDGIPNRYDRVYNPRWDRDGDGVPNRYDRHPGRRG